MIFDRLIGIDDLAKNSMDVGRSGFYYHKDYVSSERQKTRAVTWHVKMREAEEPYNGFVRQH